MSHLLAGVPEAKEYPCCDVHQEVGDHREAVPDRGQQRPGVLIIWSLSFSSSGKSHENHQRGMRGLTCEISYEGKVGYLHGSPAKLEYNDEEWVIQHLLVCTHSKYEIIVLYST